MEVSTKIARYKELFETDPLYQEINRRDLTGELFDSCLLYDRVYFDNTYSTKQAAELLEIAGKEQTLLNYLNRNDFTDYIDIGRQGKRGYYRYNYKSLFQFKMILLLTNHDLTPFDIAAIVGTRPEYSSRERTHQNSPVSRLPQSQSYEDIEEIFDEKASELVNHIGSQLENIMLEQQRTSLKKDLNTWEAEIRGIVGRIDDIDMNVQIYKLILEQLETKREPESKSFLGKLFGSKTEPVAVDNSEYKKRLEELEERKQQLIQEKEKLDDKKEDIVKSLEQVNQRIKERTAIKANNPNNNLLNDSRREQT
ncbi:hypothetical protein FZD47_20985 [Bacillus infantis]|uniref:Uncharacterized protein n=1 Tax=Bacillus infantis TaxID=324767 RepID=A0A5D4SAK5_9BACI|nr:hypothetical protein [Bacillus infantis]TYS60685.1 hypothetical protein FZD47_20985 [Bacillus infantis]